MKKLIIAIVIGFSSFAAFGQNLPNRHEVSIWGAGGISSLQYKPSYGDHKIGFGGMAGIGYHYFFNQEWSLGIGVEYSILNSKSKYDLFEDVYNTVDNTSTMYLRIHTEGTDFKQKQQAGYINIPLMVRYQTKELWEGYTLYAAFGPKVGIPVNSSFESEGVITTKGYRLDLGSGEPITSDPYINMPHRGFGTYDYKSDGELDLKLNYILSLEAGVKWEFNNNWGLYTGLYFDYGLNNIINKSDEVSRFIHYDKENPAEYASNSIFDSKHSLENIDYVDKVKTVSFGVKAQLAFGFKQYVPKKKRGIPVYMETGEEEDADVLTASKMEEIMSRNIGKLSDEQRKEFEKVRELLMEEPDFAGSITGFDFTKSNILPEMIPELDRKAKLLRKYPSVTIILVGHTDDISNDDINYNLGIDRASSVRAYLIAKGVNGNQLKVSSKGRSEPAIPNNSESNRRFNRRVDFVVE